MQATDPAAALGGYVIERKTLKRGSSGIPEKGLSTVEGERRRFGLREFAVIETRATLLAWLGHALRPGSR
jgi:hypothetical protein